MDYLRRPDVTPLDLFFPGVSLYMWRSATYTDPGRNHAHLRWVMYDAGANTSKYQLWLDARAREQAKWLGTNWGTPTMDNRGTTPSTSHHIPSTPVTHTAAAPVLPQTLTRKETTQESQSTNESVDDEVAYTDMRRLKTSRCPRLIVISYLVATVMSLICILWTW
ncbi:hypothetical protein EDD17DRAFT_86032 [Pisolithus thermaeus]|nr:hypothetical protein EDD17DRAFT_207196 [Pisolithus thermaeus]KAI6146985.1 hypothetical protein EDD17DRAFT_86032 [Pisolithus thermaeus]